MVGEWTLEMADYELFANEKGKEVNRVKSGIERIVSLGNVASKYLIPTEPDAYTERTHEAHTANLHATLDILTQFIDDIRDQLPPLSETPRSLQDLLDADVSELPLIEAARWLKIANSTYYDADTKINDGIAAPADYDNRITSGRAALRIHVHQPDAVILADKLYEVEVANARQQG